VGRRDDAILLLLTGLGLRASEVASLRLDDIEWRGGEFSVRGKGRRAQRLPLPSDAGGTALGSHCARVCAALGEAVLTDTLVEESGVAWRH
jgi:site-specific recombinase XerC